jgi:hypothetical protein
MLADPLAVAFLFGFLASFPLGLGLGATLRCMFD